MDLNGRKEEEEDTFYVEDQDVDGANSSTDDPPLLEEAMGFHQSFTAAASKPLLKIETLHASQLTRVTWFYAATLACTIIINTVFLSLVNTVWLEEVTFGAFTYAFAEPDLWWLIIEVCIGVFFSAGVLISAIIYFIAVLRTSREERTREMLFVLVLGITLILVYLPFVEAQLLTEDIQDPGALSTMMMLSAIVNGAFGITGLFFYCWSTTISFRTPRDKSFTWTYYFKMSVLCFLFLMRVLSTVMLRIDFTWVPFASLGAALSAIHEVTQDPAPGTTTIVAANMGLELIIVLCIVLEIRWTQRVIGHLDYLEHRSLQIGYRQFRYYLGVTFTTSLLLGLLSVLLGSEDSIAFIAKYSGQLHLQPTAGRMAYLTLIPAFAMQQMYYMLPASAPGIRDILFCKWERKKTDVTESLFKYRMFERRGDPTFKATSFVMETCVTMFNLSWVPYSYGKAVKRQATPADFGNTKYEITLYASNAPTDTHGLVYSADDRIVVAFKGTQSGANVRTDLQAAMYPLNRFVEGFVIEDQVHHLRKGWVRKKMQPMIHKGFGFAYTTVRQLIWNEVHRLYEENPRPLFFTGHSLGGALATLCAMDCSKTISPVDGCYAFTYGSPRVGNKQFVEEYNREVPCTWRLVHAEDPVTKLPPALFFRHVGQSALITRTGNLFIDPTLFEMGWMHSKIGIRCKMKIHKKTGYAVAISAFIEKQHQTLMGDRGRIWRIPKKGIQHGDESSAEASNTGSHTVNSNVRTIDEIL
ncbi:hypothetical protein NDN08_000531 [Rhodosorus marinus]|uniref:Fungal lipase-type domain-containing protein n=1 Tax=Rhodosorus marinus TaxID=101924 RepID=A0AAV8UTU8_9RHOD|nr:hypothetical protein NDN08_000531 [Rhodosorus marinus]